MAMPLAEYIAEVMTILDNNPEIDEVVVERCKPFRMAAESGRFAAAFGMLNPA